MSTTQVDELNKQQHGDSLIHRQRQTPLSWDELQNIILHVQDLSLLARSGEQTNTYRKCRATINNEWVSIYDYLLCTKFGFDWVYAEDSETDVSSPTYNQQQTKKRSNPTFQKYLQQRESSTTTTTTKQQLKLCLNDFPYYFEPNIHHYVLWKLGGVVTAGEITQAKKDILCQAHTSVVDIDKDHEVFLHWINPPHLKSLPGIDHVHILYRSV